ncbi:MAG TPA: hypothetical protein VJ417_08855, partial [Candidatus Glassbacteria bacterium]|nr:hypothetical protein [Candidatus Glassbacteria bacterium]
MGLTEVMAFWWRERVRIASLALGGLAAAGALVLAAYVLRPARQETTLNARMLFEGVDRGQYPNGNRFAPADLVATPVLQEVFRRNGMDRFVEFEDFKDSFAVTNVNPATERLRREYQARVQDRRLTPPDRQKIENEFETRLKSLQNGEYTLVLDAKGTFRRWPKTLAGKILDDVLNAWAEQSRARGLFRFDLNIYSENILGEIDPDTDDYPLVLDRLRVLIDRVLRNLQQLSAIPGSRLLRVGDRNISLGEIEVLLQDDLEYRLSMIEAPVYTAGLSRDQMMSTAYIREQLFRLQRETQNAQSQIAGVQQALATYSASRAGGLPGVSEGAAQTSAPGESFLDQVLDLSTQGADIGFRQDLVRDLLRLNREIASLADERQIYERMQSELAAKGRKVEAARSEMEPWVQEQIRNLLAGLRRTLGYVRLLHEEISEKNLQPSMVYTTAEPLRQRSLSTVSLRTVVLGAG